MQLFRPAFLGVQPSEKEHHVGDKLLVFQRAGRPSLARPIENRRGFGVGTECRVAAAQPVIGKPRAQRMKVIVPATQGIG